MRILISNDDGIYAPGIKALATRLAEDPQHDIYVVAPDRERSATGHSLTLHKPLRVEEVELPGKMRRCWSTTGTPSDCVKLAISVLMEDNLPDLVISGINNGANLGAEVLYSGTVAAAMEGAFLSVPSIAVSMVTKGEGKHFEVAAEFMSKFIGVYNKAHLGPKTLINVNVPSLPADRIKGVRVTELGIRAYDDYFEKRHDPRGRDYYWLTGHAIEEGEAETSDAYALAHDMISITPIAFNMTDRAVLPKLESLPGLAELSKFAEKTVEK
ncbi:MAG: 5'/3'-nucleotidase SurE [Candidatus Melainabacteria bacterium]|nr:5'/3'-nucleotidase SurE [Candidatus Melainabacteria bacterium]